MADRVRTSAYDHYHHRDFPELEIKGPTSLLGRKFKGLLVIERLRQRLLIRTHSGEISSSDTLVNRVEIRLQDSQNRRKFLRTAGIREHRTQLLARTLQSNNEILLTVGCFILIPRSYDASELVAE